VPGDLLDYVLLVVCLSFAYGGFRQGFVVGVLSFVGIFGGGLVGTRVAVPIVHAVDGWVSAPVAGMVVVFVAAAIGQALAVTLGMMLRSRLRWQPARLVDNAGGAVLSVLAVLLVVWVLATSVAHSSLTGLSRQVRNSAIIRTVDEAVPGSVQSALDQFRNLLDTSGFPAIVGPLTNEPAAAVPAPDPAVLGSAAVQVARGSTVKVTGIARSCSRRIEGSGFVYAPQRVMTNAHVVAGVAAPSVQVDGKQLRATVVLYDPDRDIAVLAVPGLQAPSLAFAGTAAHGDGAVVAGYPEDGPFRAVAARIRGRQDIRGPNIYQNKTVTRDVYAIRATVLPGNSGGPLLASDGRVFGVVFAASTDTADTGYVLTAAEVAGDAAAGRTAQARVGTGSCD
jgi:S1-C subfamily serine protease